MLKKLNQSGFVAVLEIFLVILVFGIIAFVGMKMFGGSGSGDLANDITWSFDGDEWQASGTPPQCPEPLLLTPVDMTKVTAILYPGQYRGEDYKAHGGFRFKDGANSQTVKIPLDATIYTASRYIEGNEVQYFFTMIAPCGVMYRFDHLLTLTPDFQEIADTLPEPKVDDSRTTVLTPAPAVKSGDVIATAVGFKKTGNVGVDFGLYDLRQKNTVSQTTAWQKAHPDEKEFGQYGLCWLDYLTSADSKIAKSLPGGDGQSGEQSDYCK